MAVCHFVGPDGERIGPKDFPAPATATVAHWYRAANKVIRELPNWRIANYVVKQVTIDLIHFEVAGGDLFIARKQHLR
jgi:hypothetical protein